MTSCGYFCIFRLSSWCLGFSSFRNLALVVGRLTTRSAGLDALDVKLYFDGGTIDNNLDTIAWSLSDSFSSSMAASNLLLWLNGSGNGELDAIRVGTTWEDVTGVVAVPEPTVAGLGLVGLVALLRRCRGV